MITSWTAEGPASGLAANGPNPADLYKGGFDDISIPNDVDYLKVRVYLYKFTPEMVYAGKHKPKTFTSTAVELSSAQFIATQAGNLRTFLLKVQADLNNAIPTRAEAASISSYKPAAESLGKLLTLPTLSQDFKLILSDPSKDPSGNTANAFGGSNTSKFMDFTQSGYNTAKNLLETLTRGVTDVATFNSQKNTVLSLITQAIKILDGVITSANNAKSKLASTLNTTLASTLSQFEVSRFSYDLNPEDLSRYDLSNFVSSYRVDQQLGMLSPGGIAASVTFQNNLIIPLSELAEVPGPNSVRRPWFFPDERGAYKGYDRAGEFDVPFPTNMGIPATGVQDPITKEYVSTLGYDTLVSRIAMAQTLEDNGGKNTSEEFATAYDEDVVRTEIAMRIRGIYDPRKKQLINEFFRKGGDPDDELVRLVTPNVNNSVFAKGVATAQLQFGVTPLGFSSALNENQKKIKAKMSGLDPEDLAAKLEMLKSVLTNPANDGILLSDLIQKYDFLSIFIYKHEVSPDIIESTLLGVTQDPNFFDKESLFLYTPVNFLLDSDFDTRFFATYSPEFNGFVVQTTSTQVPGDVNNLTIQCMGSMGLMGATQRIYSASLFQDSVFDAAELADDRLFNLYQNIFVDKDPFEILTSLLEALYLLRVNIPIQNVELSEKDRDTINRKIAVDFAGAPSEVIAAKQSTALKQAEQKLKNSSTKGAGEYTVDVDKNVTSFLDILSLRAFNQFGETDPQNNNIIKGPKHIFNIPSFLYANVMRGRRFNVRVPTAANIDALDSKYGGRGNTNIKPFDKQPAPSNQVKGAFNPYNTSSGGAIKPLLYVKEGDGSGGSILEINPYLSSPSTLGTSPTNQKVADDPEGAHSWKVYFKILSGGFSSFVADVKSGLEIMTDVTNTCYLELFETPGGRFIFRTPQYNNNIPIYRTIRQDDTVVQATDTSTLATDSNQNLTVIDTSNESSNFAHMLTSEDIRPISASYDQTAKNLLAKQQVSFASDLVGVLIEQLAYFYSNGKVVSQYGLNLGRAIINPNVRFTTKQKLAGIENVDDATFAQGIFHYCRFFLEYNNLNCFTGTISAVGDPRIQVGRTYFDVANQKFGYIQQVSKTLTVGREYVATFKVNAVRDATYGKIQDQSEAIGRPTFRKVPEIEDLIPHFTNGVTKVKNVPATQAHKAPATDSLNTTKFFDPMPKMHKQ